MVLRVISGAGLAILLLLAGCERPTLRARLASDDPKVRIGAIFDLTSAPAGDAEAQLIYLLADEDEGVRFFAAAALYRRTGERLGFEAQGRLRDRIEAIERWIGWHAETYPNSGPLFDDLKRDLDSVLGGSASVAPAPAATEGQCASRGVEAPKEEGGGSR